MTLPFFKDWTIVEEGKGLSCCKSYQSEGEPRKEGYSQENDEECKNVPTVKLDKKWWQTLYWMIKNQELGWHNDWIPIFIGFRISIDPHASQSSKSWMTPKMQEIWRSNAIWVHKAKNNPGSCPGAQQQQWQQQQCMKRTGRLVWGSMVCARVGFCCGGWTEGRQENMRAGTEW